MGPRAGFVLAVVLGQMWVQLVGECGSLQPWLGWRLRQPQVGATTKGCNHRFKVH